MQRLACQTCGAALHWNGQTPTVRCSFCGAEYLMHPREARHAQRASNMGRGQVDAIALTQGIGAGMSVAQSFIPKDWRVSTQAIDQGTSVVVPVILDVSYDRGDNTTRLRYQSLRLYEHLDNSPQNAAAQGQFQLSHGAITLAHRNTQTVCDEQAVQLAQGLVGTQHLQLLNESRTAPATMAKSAQTARESFVEQGLQNINFEWCHRHYLAQTHAGNRHLVVEALGVSYYQPPSQREIIAYQQLAPLLAQSQMRLMGLMGMGMGMGMSNVPQPPQPKLFWGTLFIGSLVASDNTVVEASELLEKVRDSFEMLPACSQLRRQIEDYLLRAIVQANNAEAQAFSQMTAAQNASWDRRNRIIQDANDHANSVMHSMFADTAATNDRVANLRSESIRGVNTYHTNQAGYGQPNVVEADVRYDHVWQSSEHPDTFVAAEGDWLEPGLDFEELPRTNGSY